MSEFTPRKLVETHLEIYGFSDGSSLSKFARSIKFVTELEIECGIKLDDDLVARKYWQVISERAYPDYNGNPTDGLRNSERAVYLNLGNGAEKILRALRIPKSNWGK